VKSRGSRLALDFLHAACVNMRGDLAESEDLFAEIRNAVRKDAKEIDPFRDFLADHVFDGMVRRKLEVLDPADQIAVIAPYRIVVDIYLYAGLGTGDVRLIRNCVGLSAALDSELSRIVATRGETRELERVRKEALEVHGKAQEAYQALTRGLPADARVK
jgi:hypothetical protein